MTVASGYADVALAVGWERMSEVDTKTGNKYITKKAKSGEDNTLVREYGSRLFQVVGLTLFPREAMPLNKMTSRAISNRLLSS